MKVTLNLISLTLEEPRVSPPREERPSYKDPKPYRGKISKTQETLSSSGRVGSDRPHTVPDKRNPYKEKIQGLREELSSLKKDVTQSK
jgi:hypothetical protein